ncbi:maleylpyruvate isomerase family mycothiol-dependent enzyme [Streptomyces caniscabiei]|uniref:Maleylpyruvate isomerase family mycothiol-dependent enzyme n=1 Tax=Streptomyces caniscabiei TaxID=2746961 RepID=A0ABU4N4B0_9ACTN|nr:maleylpyruvate isomerase family mycothiol-dependent enzyme [Streptomyces caniscabiei]MBE4734008.1 maleylpyruvate isomerase family mycothiol-dependent enzyme [Streptomyces caniscabiei]MBE4761423.1 maleylpyruvate isomerase family mycothiol-dependent enzyme [Streptomyces caniscabiei]MBE4775150.1 maleylpyruvate isomerase family mycothiol-dependent enzyme [Streptomyces caniscabiei]MBE4782503.1 maleylpyruvate isomerase family mycothiol-dependent enzyme [Streptomyces caniscabiei]MBE4791806.1 maley
MSGRPDAMLEWLAKGTAAFEAAVRRATDASLLRPSCLPGWSRAHVVAHLARNADALLNLLNWARTGVETPMYASPGLRAAEIEEGARRPADELRADLLQADGRLAGDLAALPDECWEATVRTARGREVPVREVPWMRVREVWVHAVDLDTGTSFDDIPREVCAALVDDVAAGLRARTDMPPVELRAEDGGRTWLLGVPGAAKPVSVTGDLPSLAAYATGRRVPGPLYGAGGGSVPKLPAWL